MKIFGSLYPFFHFDFEKGSIIGLKVSVLEFFKALSRYSSFDQIHLYVSDLQELARFKEILEKLEIPVDQTKRIFSFANARLPENLTKYDYTVFFHGDPATYLLSYIRTNLMQDKFFPISCFVHDLSPNNMPDFFLKLALADFYPFDSFICPSEAVKTVLSQHLSRILQFIKQRTGKTLKFPPKLALLPLGVDTEKFKPREKDKARDTLKLPQDKIIILAAGRLNPYFKMDLFPLLQVMKKLTATVKNKNFLLLIVGQEQLEGYADELRKTAHELGLDNYVQIQEKFDNRLMPLYFSAADIFVSPSDNVQETFGITPIEAMASGLPVVVSDWNGYREGIAEGSTGFKIPTIWGKIDTKISEIAPAISSSMAPQFALAESIALNLNKLTEVLQKLLENHNLRKKMGQAARAKALETYSWKAIIKLYEKLWVKSKDLELKSKIKTTQDKIWLEKIPYFNFYKHYPTELLAVKTKIKATAYGRKYLEVEKLAIGLETIARLGNPKIMRLILEFCLNNFQTVEKIFTQFKIKNPLDKEIYTYQILFMIKHGLLEYQ